MKTPSRPVIFGEVLFDRFPDGSEILGGAPFNVAWHLQAFGAAPLFLSRIGNDDLGMRVLKAMEVWGMDQSGMQRDGTVPTGTVDVCFTDGEPEYDIVINRAYDCIEGNQLPPLPRNNLLYHGTLALRHATSRATLEVIRRELDGPRFVDINLRSPWWELETVKKLIARADVVKLNEHEMEHMCPQAVTVEDRASRLLQESGMETLIVTRGRSGAAGYLADGSILTARPCPAELVVDTVGAGDAFSSVLILGHLLSWPLETTLARAQDFARAIIGVRGATSEDPKFYQMFLNNWGM